MKLHRKLLISLCASLAWAASAAAVDYPNKTVRLILPNAAGSSVDTVARMTATLLEQRWKQPVVVENRVGAAGLIGTQAVARAAPDGYTVLYSSSGISIFKILYKDIGFEPLKDLAPVTWTVDNQGLHVVNAALPVKSLTELVAYAKQNPGKVNYASNGRGVIQLGTEAFKQQAGINMVDIPFQGTPPMITATLRNEVQYMVSAAGILRPHIDSGAMRPIAVMGKTRLPAYPNVPTVTEQGYPNFIMASTHGVLAPAGTPKDILDRLNADFVWAGNQREFREKIVAMGITPMGTSADEYRARLELEMKVFADVAAALGIKPE